MNNKKQEIELEIEVLHNIIDLLNECLRINIQHLKIQYAMNCLKDIRLCKEELKKLVIAKESALEVIKEQNHDEVQRSRTGFS
jgi:hypothetical protein